MNISTRPRWSLGRGKTVVPSRWQATLHTKKGRAAYARRKAIVEPAFGQLKVAQDAGQVRLPGLDDAQGEWTLHTFCHNIRKLRNSGFHWIPTMAVS